MKFVRPVICIVMYFIIPFFVFAQEPEAVPEMVRRSLDKASYVELAKQWKAHIKKHGESPRALVNLSKAYRYSSELEAARIAAERAVELDPDYPPALNALADIFCRKADPENNDRAIELLEKCLDIEPDYEGPVYTLAAIYMRVDTDKADRVLKTIFERDYIETPLMDYAYNMLVGLPEGAVLVTNGDNDTFPPLALQQGIGFRTDVAIINYSLFNLPEYRELIFKRYPAIRIKGEIDAEEGSLTAASVALKKIVEENKAPIYYAYTVAFNKRRFKPEMSLEGLNRRVTGKGLTGKQSASLFLDTYRLDSATDFTFPWDLYPSLRRMMKNYIGTMNVDSPEWDEQTRRKLIEKALKIAEFHKWNDLVLNLRNYLEKEW
jgi:tetratricopeptide (TPR) repeat protein